MINIIIISNIDINTPLGHSQVYEVTKKCSQIEKNYKFHIVYIAKQKIKVITNESDNLRLKAIKTKYSGKFGAVISYLKLMTYCVYLLIKYRGHKILHARSYLPAIIALLSSFFVKTPYVFDTRGFWFDERAEQNRFLQKKRVYNLLKKFEKSLFSRAQAFVCLTELGSNMIIKGTIFNWPEDKPYATIPTCANYENFTINKKNTSDQITFGYIGSVNSFYKTEECIKIFKQIRDEIPNAHLLCVTQDRDKILRLITNHGIGFNHFSILTALHTEIPKLLNQIDWGFLILESPFSKSASMPTKLAEFLASGVRPIHYGCNSEVSYWVRKTKSGISLQDLTKNSIDRLIETIKSMQSLSYHERFCTLNRARDISFDHFSLDSGCQKYIALWKKTVQENLWT